MVSKARQRVAGYVRISKETEETTSPERQRQAIQRLCDERGWDLVELFEDLDVSAFNGRRREQFTRMMGRLADFDAIVFWKLDRLSRSSVEAGQIAEACNDAAVNLVATDMNIDTTSAGGRFIYTVLAAAGEMESARTSERSRSMMAYKRERHEWVGREPYGWRVKDKRLVPNPKEQKVLRDAARRYVNGVSFNVIAQSLGMHTAALSRILQSDRVAEALPAELSVRFTEALAARKRERVPTSKRSLLGGLAKCGECGGSMSLSSTRAGRRGRWQQYRCPAAGHAGIAGPWLDEHVTAQVLAVVDTGKLLAAIRRRRKPGRSRKVSELEARIEHLDSLYVDGTVSKARFELMQSALLDQLAAAQKNERDSGVDLPVELARDLSERWGSLTTMDRRRVIGTVLSSVTIGKANGSHGPIDDRRVSIEWRV